MYSSEMRLSNESVLSFFAVISHYLRPLAELYKLVRLSAVTVLIVLMSLIFLGPLRP